MIACDKVNWCDICNPLKQFFAMHDIFLVFVENVTRKENYIRAFISNGFYQFRLLASELLVMQIGY